MIVRKKKGYIYLDGKREIKIPFPKILPKVVGEANDLVFLQLMNMRNYDTKRLAHAHNMLVLSKELRRVVTVEEVSKELNGILSGYPNGYGAKLEISKEYEDIIREIVFNGKWEERKEEFKELDKELENNKELYKKKAFEHFDIEKKIKGSKEIENDITGEKLYIDGSKILNDTGDILFEGEKGKLEDFNDYYFVMSYGAHSSIIDRRNNKIIIDYKEKASIIELTNTNIFVLKKAGLNRVLMNSDGEVLEKNIRDVTIMGENIIITKNNKIRICDSGLNIIKEFDEQYFKVIKDKLLTYNRKDNLSIYDKYINLEYNNKNIKELNIDEGEYIIYFDKENKYHFLHLGTYNDFNTNKSNIGPIRNIKNEKYDIIYYEDEETNEATFIRNGEEIDERKVIKILINDEAEPMSIFN